MSSVCNRLQRAHTLTPTHTRTQTRTDFFFSSILINQSPNNFLTPARRDNATLILLGDCSNKGRESVYETLGVPPSKLKASQFVDFCAEYLGRAHNHNFLALDKGVGKLYLTSTAPLLGGEEEEEEEGEEEDAVAHLAHGVKGLGLAAGGGGGGGAAAAAYKPNKDMALDFLGCLPGTVEPLLQVLNERHESSLIWEPTEGLGGLKQELEAGGFTVIGTDLYKVGKRGKLTRATAESFIETEDLEAMEPPEGVELLVLFPPFSQRVEFYERVWELGLPAYILSPYNDMAKSSLSDAFQKHGVEVFCLSGAAAHEFYSPEQKRPVKVASPCCWYGLNTGAKKGTSRMFHIS